MKRSVLGIVVLAITLAVLIVLIPATRGEDPCERLSDGPVFQIVADHGAASYVPLIDAIEDAFAQAALPRRLEEDDIRIVREEGRTTIVTVDSYYALLDTSPSGYWPIAEARPCSSWAA